MLLHAVDGYASVILWSQDGVSVLMVLSLVCGQINVCIVSNFFVRIPEFQY